MTLYEKLTLANLVISCVMLVIMVVAIVPHLQRGMAVVRDAVLWVAMVLVVGMIVSGVWLRFGPTAALGRADSASGSTVEAPPSWDE